MKNIKEFMKVKEYLVVAAIRRLKIKDHLPFFCELGLGALEQAIKTFDDRPFYNDFDQYAYYFILRILKSRLDKSKVKATSQVVEELITEEVPDECWFDLYIQTITTNKNEFDLS